MNAALVTLLAFAALVAAYWFYGRVLGRVVFRLDPNRHTPAHRFQDGMDFVPTRVPVLFGHHFASIAGLGPILGPAIAVIWGWVPAVLWVVLGSIFLGAVHDLGALTVSLRYRGRSIGDVTRDLIGPRARLLFLLIIFFLMSLAMGVFVLVISQLMVRYYPDAILPTAGLMVVAMLLGVAVYRFRWRLGPLSVLGITALFGLIYLGVENPLPTHTWFIDDPAARQALADAQANGQMARPYGAAQALAHFQAAAQSDPAQAPVVQSISHAASQAEAAWSWMLLGYALAASILPVWLLLQPRDYLNSYQLYAGLALLLVGLLVMQPTIEAPAVNHSAAIEAPPWFPFLFITIACGAISGFHSLVSSGTTVRQLNRETDAVMVGYGGMLVEGALAVLVIMACVAGLGAEPWGPDGIYSNFKRISGGGISTQLSAVVEGGGTFLATLGIERRFGQAFIAVAVVAFALTTLDSATRLLRYNVEEIFRSVGLRPLANRWVGSLVAVLGIAFFAFLRVDGKPAGVILWTLFGTTNQLLAGLTLLTVSLFLFKLKRPLVYTLLPMIAMLGISLYAMILNLKDFLAAQPRNYPLIVVSLIVLAMTTWLLVEAVLAFRRGRADFVLEEDDQTPAVAAPLEPAPAQAGGGN